VERHHPRALADQEVEAFHRLGIIANASRRVNVGGGFDSVERHVEPAL
jgi:hypothetical protein